jgi:hypothetical protein
VDVNSVNALMQTLLAPALVALAVWLAMKKTPIPIADTRLLQMVDRLQIRVDELEKDLRLVQTWAARLSAQVVSLGGQPITITDIEQAHNGTIHALSNEPQKLLQILRNEFDIDELELIGLELGVRKGMLGDGDVDARAAKLFRHAEAQRRLPDLAFAIWRERPAAARGYTEK